MSRPTKSAIARRRLRTQRSCAAYENPRPAGALRQSPRTLGHSASGMRTIDLGFRYGVQSKILRACEAYPEPPACSASARRKMPGRLNRWGPDINAGLRRGLKYGCERRPHRVRSGSHVVMAKQCDEQPRGRFERGVQANEI